MKIVKSLEETELLIKEFLGMLLGTLRARLLGNLLTAKGTIRTIEGTIRTCQDI